MALLFNHSSSPSNFAISSNASSSGSSNCSGFFAAPSSTSDPATAGSVSSFARAKFARPWLVMYQIIAKNVNPRMMNVISCVLSMMLPVLTGYQDLGSDASLLAKCRRLSAGG